MAIVHTNFGSLLAPELKKVYAEEYRKMREIDAANIFNNAFTTSYHTSLTPDPTGNWQSFYGSIAPDKPKIGKVLAYLSPLLLILGITRNPEVSRRDIFKPWRWFK